MALNVVMLGPPGAGKGTQAERLAAAYRVPKISTGDILREAAQAGTELGRAVKSVMESGQLVSDDLMVQIVRERLGRADAACGFVLDGFPRTVAQARALDTLVQGRGAVTVLHIAVPNEVLVTRLGARRVCGGCGDTATPGMPVPAVCPKCGGVFVTRRDDDEQVVRQRLTVYERQTRPLIDYYRSSPSFFEIDGDRSPDAVFAGLQAVLDPAVVVGVSKGAGVDCAS
jgi:adenylate kinase